jgi:hypothetical protein
MQDGAVARLQRQAYTHGCFTREIGTMSNRPRPSAHRDALLICAVALVLVVVAWGGWRAYQRSKYPYGWSHSCDKAMGSALLAYADAHKGVYPAGEPTPEASLSLLFPNYFDDVETAAELLRGKTVPADVVRDRLSRGEPLTPDTCGWHYVEGLTVRDDPRLALLWDKVGGLGHHGERVSDGGHYVVLVGGQTEHIPGDQGATFLQEQERLLAARNLNKQRPPLASHLQQPGARGSPARLLGQCRVESRW